MLEIRGPRHMSRDADVASSGPLRIVGLRRLAVPFLLLLLLACARTRSRAPAFATDSTGDDRIAACGPGQTGPGCEPASLAPVPQRLAYLGFAAAGLIALAGIAWFLRVRAEVRSLQQPAFLVLPPVDGGAVPIAGADRDGLGGPFGVGGTGLVAGWPMPLARGATTVTGAAGSAAGPPGGEGGGPVPGSQPLVFAAGSGRSAEEPVQASDATLQFLPGRLVHEGGVKRPDIHFIRQPGPATVVTLGRQEGTTGKHVRLIGPTVSRLHARMRFSGGRWTIGNLSQTNPLRVNGRALGSSAETHLLSDGDRVEVGEVVLVFRER